MSSKRQRADVAYLITAGYKLSIKEFQIAVETKMLGGRIPASDTEWAEAYLDWMGSHYEDDERQGYLCSSKPISIETNPDGSLSECFWGIHMDQVKPDKLTPENLKHLRHYFGKAKVKEITGR